MLLKNAVRMSHMWVEKVVQVADTVIDATCGNGHDALFLAGLVPQGRVFAFDIADEAIANTRKVIDESHLSERVSIIKDNHINIPHYLNQPVKAIMFNLGYLPGSRIGTTVAENSLQAIASAIPLLAAGGLMTIVCYTGHPGGREEADIIIDHVSKLPQQEFEVVKMKFLNQINHPPILVMVQRI